ncbi:unnamed protein product [Sympodiomycopsis kandeliae]
MATTHTSALGSSSAPLLARLHPSLYLSNHLSHSSRPSTSTSSPLEFPTVDINLSPLHSADSSSSEIPSPSSLVRYGSTTVICKISPTIVYPDAITGSSHNSNSSSSSTTNSNTIIPSIVLSPLSSPSSDFKSGPPSSYAQQITERLYSILDSSLPFDKDVLNIPADEDAEEEQGRVRAKWCLFADCSVIGFDGGLLEASHLAIVSALRQLQLPKAHYSLDDNVVIASSNRSDYWKLAQQFNTIPLVFGFGIYQGNLLTTPSSFESSLVSTSINITLSYPSGGKEPKLVAINSNGPLSLTDGTEDEQVLEKCITLAVQAGKKITSKMV